MVVAQETAGFLEEKKTKPKAKDSFLQYSSGEGRKGQQRYKSHIKLFCTLCKFGTLARNTWKDNRKHFLCLLQRKLEATEITEGNYYTLLKQMSHRTAETNALTTFK